MLAYVLAVLIVAPVLAGAALWGADQGRRGALPGWFVAVLIVVGLVTKHPVTAAIGSAWALAYVWGHRARSRTAKSSRRQRRQLDRALRNHELQFYYQPVLDQSADEPVVVSAEALVRWLKPNGKMVFPGPWLDAIQADPDLSCRFSDLLWEDCAIVAGLFPHISISVNTMPDKVAEAGWADRLLSLMPAGSRPAQFTIEVLEGALLADTPTVRSNLTKLRAAGFHIALDDFGSGNANMVTLMTFLDLVDTVKVDQVLIRHEDRRGAESIIDLAQSFGKLVVAEGVETQDQADWLRDLDVCLVQGWLHSKALSLTEFSSFVMHHGGFREGVVY